MFVDVVFVYDKLDEASNSIDVNGLELTSSEASFVIRRQCYITNKNSPINHPLDKAVLLYI